MRDEGASVIRLALCPRAAIVEQVRLKLFDPVLEMGDVTNRKVTTFLSDSRGVWWVIGAAASFVCPASF